MSLTSCDAYAEIVQKLPGYEPRPMQAAMAEAITDALVQRETIVIEAGTGSGKSFGYLIPVILSDRRPIVLSTGTIALQEQLMEKDIPFIGQAAGKPHLKARLVKGRRNYLCLQKLQEFERTVSAQSAEKLYVQALKSAFQTGWDGDKATLDLEVPMDLWDEVQSDSEDCLGNKCGYYAQNPYRLAREDLDEADILVVNHALYLQDLISGQALLPRHDLVVFDEAHQLKAFALGAFTARIGKYATQKLIRKIDRRLQRIPDGAHEAMAHIEAHLLEWLYQAGRNTFKLYPDSRFLDLVDQKIGILGDIRDWVAAVDLKQLSVMDSEAQHTVMSVQRQKLLDQLDTLIGKWVYFSDPETTLRVNWAEVKPDRLYYELKSTPLNIAELLDKALWQERQGILTSATLSTGNTLTAFRQDLGIPMPTSASPDRVLASPFDFQRQCALYLPRHLPEPNDPFFLPAAVEDIVRILAHTQGRAFVLVTSYQSLSKLSAAVIPQVPFPCKTQGDLPKKQLVSWFKTTPNSVLFATASFWEGIDIPGPALSCVIMDRIPFTSPDDPVHSAMVDHLKRQGRDWFTQYALPQAVVRLKQGFGRLIRTQTDTGLVAILDTRLHRKGYGKTILASLPAVHVCTTLAALPLEMFPPGGLENTTESVLAEGF